MISLNLLPPAQKDALQSRMLYAVIERVVTALVLFSALSGLLLVAIKIRLAHNLARIQERQILTEEYAAANADIGALERQLSRVDALQQMAVSPSALLQDIARRTPPGVAIASLAFDAGTARLDLTGIAARREDLLAYEEALKASPFVAQLDSPISNLFRKTDADFRFTIQLRADALKKPYEPAL